MIITKEFLQGGIKALDAAEEQKKSELNYIIGQRDAYRFLLEKLYEQGGEKVLPPPIVEEGGSISG